MKKKNITIKLRLSPYVTGVLEGTEMRLFQHSV